MVTALVFGSSGPGSNPSREHCFVFLGKTQMGNGEFNAEWTSIPSRENRNIPNRFMLQKPG